MLVPPPSEILLAYPTKTKVHCKHSKNPIENKTKQNKMETNKNKQAKIMMECS